MNAPRESETTAAAHASGPAASGPAASGPAASGPAASGPIVSRDNFDALVKTYQTDVRTFIARFVHNASIADDLAQDVFVTAYRKLSDYNGTGTFKSWLLGMARNVSLVYLRSESRRRRREGEFVLASLDRQQAARLDRFDEQAAEHEAVLETLRGCISELPSISRELITSFYFRREKADAIARRENKSNSAIRMALLRIRRSLAKCVRSKTGRAESEDE